MEPMKQPPDSPRASRWSRVRVDFLLLLSLFLVAVAFVRSILIDDDQAYPPLRAWTFGCRGEFVGCTYRHIVSSEVHYIPEALCAPGVFLLDGDFDHGYPHPRDNAYIEYCGIGTPCAMFLLVGAYALVWLRRGLLIRATRLAEERKWRCQACGYNLIGNESGRCPECGGALPEWQKGLCEATHPTNEPPAADDER